MFYYIIRLYVRIVFVFFFKSIRVKERGVFNQKGPLLLACNHPNSFLDAIILGAKFNHPVHFLARGDAFKNPFVKKLLSALKAIPIYRLKKGREYLSLNDATFEKCTSILERGGIVLIFSEGLCMNQWELRPLKKGSARIALGAWNNKIQNLKVIPVTLNYNSFRVFRKRMVIEFQEAIQKKDIRGLTESEQINNFNDLLYDKLQKGVLFSKNKEKVVQWILSNEKRFQHPGSVSSLKQLQEKIKVHELENEIGRLDEPGITALDERSACKAGILVILLLVPAVIGLLLNYPIYYLLKKVIALKTANTVFYDSALFAAILLIYPLYYSALNLIGFLFIRNEVLQAMLIFMPLISLATFMVKDNLQAIINYLILNKDTRSKLRGII